MKILISACLLGIPCRYDGKSKQYDDIVKLADICELIPFCPECYGGLPTPRNPAEINGCRVISKIGTDVTDEYKKGARASLALCKQLNINVALLKQKSPSCGKGKIYDGSFSGKLIDGNGITTDLLLKSNIKVYGENETDSLFRMLKGESK